MTVFNVGDVVECKHGTGVVTFFEDDYMDVRLDKDKSERNFFAPFEGKVWPWVKPVPYSELPEWDEIVSAISQVLEHAELEYVKTSLMIKILGGDAPYWDTLTSFQKVNHVAVHTGLPQQIWLEALREGDLHDLAANALESYKAR